MSYFMTVTGKIAPLSSNAIELIPAHLAQDYIAKLEAHLESMDGSPVYLVHDGESGTSDGLVADLKAALWEKTDPSATTLYCILSTCFESGINFRIWLASDAPDALATTSEAVSDMASTLEAFKLQHGAWWHAV